MAVKTWDIEDPRELPYRFVYSPVTGEVFVISFWRSIGVPMLFENRESFHRFLAEGVKTDHEIADKVIQQAGEILRSKREVEG